MSGGFFSELNDRNLGNQNLDSINFGLIYAVMHKVSL